MSRVTKIKPLMLQLGIAELLTFLRGKGSAEEAVARIYVAMESGRRMDFVLQKTKETGEYAALIAGLQMQDSEEEAG
jgi:hypothetical protein